MLSVFDFTDYKTYLLRRLDEGASRGRGERSKIAAALRCHSAYVTQVLNKSAHFSLEQTADLNLYLGHSEHESEYLLALVTHARAGSDLLRRQTESRINQLRKKHSQVVNRLALEGRVSDAHRSHYYSSWHYAAIHVLLSIPTLRTPQALARHLGLTLTRVREVLAFLVSAGLAVEQTGRFVAGEAAIHLPGDSPMIGPHHSHWAQRAIASLDHEGSDDLHYSSVATISKKDLPQARAILLESIEKIRALVRNSGEDTGFCYILHLFPLGMDRQTL